MLNITIKARLNPTEDPEKVKKAITNLFGPIILDYDPDESIIKAKLVGVQTLRELRSKIAQDRIRSTLNNTLTRWTDNDYLSFGINRQAAYAGHVSLNLTNEDPMGPIRIQMRGDIEDAINFLCR